jgi:hypothetical protein
LGGLSGAHW